jgi:hypothetical protein
MAKSEFNRRCPQMSAATPAVFDLRLSAFICGSRFVNGLAVFGRGQAIV